MEKRYVFIDNEKVEYFLNIKKIKNINIRVKSNGNIEVSCPQKINPKYAEEFLIKKYSWVKKQQNFLKEKAEDRETIDFKIGDNIYYLGKKYKLNILSNKINDVQIEEKTINILIKERYVENKGYIKRYYEAWLKENAMNLYTELTYKYYKEMKKYIKEFPKIEVKKMKSRWGSCIPTKNKVTFNLSLMKTPINCIEYVVVHELAHFRYQNHSKDFYKFVKIFFPDWKECRNLLNKKYNVVV